MSHAEPPWVWVDRTLYENEDGERGQAIVIACEGWATDEATLRLVAAAPDLLAALEACLGIVESEYANDPEPEDLPSWKQTIEAARKAIAKALSWRLEWRREVNDA